MEWNKQRLVETLYPRGLRWKLEGCPNYTPVLMRLVFCGLSSIIWDCRCLAFQSTYVHEGTIKRISLSLKNWSNHQSKRCVSLCERRLCKHKLAIQIIGSMCTDCAPAMLGSNLGFLRWSNRLLEGTHCLLADKLWHQKLASEIEESGWYQCNDHQANYGSCFESIASFSHLVKILEVSIQFCQSRLARTWESFNSISLTSVTNQSFSGIMSLWCAWSNWIAWIQPKLGVFVWHTHSYEWCALIASRIESNNHPVLIW